MSSLLLRTIVMRIVSLIRHCFVIDLHTRIAKYSIVVLVVFSGLGRCRSVRSVAPVFVVLQITQIGLVALVQRGILIECKALPVLGA